MCVGIHPHTWRVHYSIFIGGRAQYVIGDFDSTGVSRHTRLAIWGRDFLCLDGNGVIGPVDDEKTRGNGWPVMIMHRWLLLMVSVGIMLFLYVPVFLLIVLVVCVCVVYMWVCIYVCSVCMCVWCVCVCVVCLCVCVYVCVGSGVWFVFMVCVCM